MASPKSTPIRMIGRKLTTGPVCARPKRSASQPHWNRATTVPSEAATDSRNPTAALRGMTSERNTMVSRIGLRPTTIAMNGTRESLSRLETSMFIRSAASGRSPTLRPGSPGGHPAPRPGDRREGRHGTDVMMTPEMTGAHTSSGTALTT
jgi:hypothetical protein